MSMSIIVTCRVVGFHKWANAPKQFEYLRPRHRHEFVIQAEKKVCHNNRDVEINHLKWLIEEYLHTYYSNPCEFGGMSCEDIAEDLGKEFYLSKCMVLEDGLCGAIYEEE